MSKIWKCKNVEIWKCKSFEGVKMSISKNIEKKCRKIKMSNEKNVERRCMRSVKKDIDVV
jgi:hypothetical protein